jgi:hypothetical protein
MWSEKWNWSLEEDGVVKVHWEPSWALEHCTDCLWVLEKKYKLQERIYSMQTAKALNAYTMVRPTIRSSRLRLQSLHLRWSILTFLLRPW